MRLPRRMYPLGKGFSLGPGSTDGACPRCEPEYAASQGAFVASAGEGEGCGLIAYRPSDRAVNDSGRSAAFWKPFVGGRSRAVFSEGADPSPLDPEKVSEACEIGGLGSLLGEVLACAPPRMGPSPPTDPVTLNFWFSKSHSTDSVRRTACLRASLVAAQRASGRVFGQLPG